MEHVVCKSGSLNVCALLCSLCCKLWHISIHILSLIRSFVHLLLPFKLVKPKGVLISQTFAWYEFSFLVWSDKNHSILGITDKRNHLHVKSITVDARQLSIKHFARRFFYTYTQNLPLAPHPLCKNTNYAIHIRNLREIFARICLASTFVPHDIIEFILCVFNQHLLCLCLCLYVFRPSKPLLRYLRYFHIVFASVFVDVAVLVLLLYTKTT